MRGDSFYNISIILNIFKEFSINLEYGKVRGDHVVCDNSTADVLFLHGAGKANRTRFQGIRTRLSKKFRISSTAFDYLGHGDSTESTLPDCLKLRTEQACEVIKRMRPSGRLSIVASSMSAYIALKLTEQYQVRNLILIVPAVYHQNAYAVPFSSAFTKIIRQDSSWVNSDAWSILEAYTGNLLIIFAENDEVIPKELIKYLYDFSTNTNSRKVCMIPGAPHRILEFISGRPEYLKDLASEMNALITEKARPSSKALNAGMMIRIAQQDDLAGIVDIYNQAVIMKGATADTEPFTVADRRQWFIEHSPHQYPVWVAEETSVILGWCSLSPYRHGRKALLHTVEISYYVHEDHRRKGVGNALMQHAVNQCCELNVKTLFALLLECNLDSIKMLEKFGFARWGHMPNVANFGGEEYGHLIYGKRVRP